MKGCLDFLQAVYKVFGFTFKLNLSTRPDKFIGEEETWNKAEKVSSCACFPRKLMENLCFLHSGRISESSRYAMHV